MGFPVQFVINNNPQKFSACDFAAARARRSVARAWLGEGCRLITYWPARSMLTHFRRRAPEFRRNSRRASPVKVKAGLDATTVQPLVSEASCDPNFQPRAARAGCQTLCGPLPRSNGSPTCEGAKRAARQLNTYF